MTVTGTSSDEGVELTMLSDSTRQDCIRKFAKLASNPEMWLLEARTLFASAELMAKEVRRRWDDVGGLCSMCVNRVGQ